MAEDDRLLDQPDAGERELPEKFSLVAGGAFHSLLARFGLLEDDGLPSYTAAVGLALIAWSIPAVFVALQSFLNPQYSGWDYFQDPTVYSRYLVAILVMVSTERIADGRVGLLVRQFEDAQLLEGTNRIQFAAAVRRADRRSSSLIAELLVLIIAFLWSVATTRIASVVSVESWEAAVTDAGATVFSWGGDASMISSNTLFLFLVFRWFWRFFIWAALLRTTSKLEIQIMPLHPDRCGGLGFLGIFPAIFSGVIFALSCVIAASVYKAMAMIEGAEQMQWYALAVWLLLVSIVFLGPLLFFLRPLYMAREKAMLDYGRLAQGHHLVFYRKWIAERKHGREIVGSADPSSLSDLNASVETVYGMRIFPIDRPALVQTLVSAGLPLLLMAAVRMPLGDLLKLIGGVLL